MHESHFLTGHRFRGLWKPYV